MAPADDAGGDGVRCLLMRGGTSKGAFFLASDVPTDAAARDELMLRVLGSPDPTQIDGIGGAHPLTSKAAIVGPSTEPGVDVEYLFLQIVVDEPVVSTAQTCGNLLAAVGPFAVERGLVAASAETTTVRIRMRNTGDLATAVFATPGGRMTYAGDTAIDGVPGTAARIELEVASGERPLLPTGNVVDDVAGHRATLVDAGMPVVLLEAAGFGIRGDETPEALEADAALAAAVERVRLAAGTAMGLGDVTDETVPKVFLVSAPRQGGTIATRAFIPRRVHTSIGVLMAASVAAGVQLPGAVGAGVAHPPASGPVLLEHPSGVFAADVHVHQGADGVWRSSSSSIRTARPLFDGVVFPRPAL